MSVGVGTRIGPYEVTSPLGEGGMGVVFRAHDTKLQRDVALKLLPDHFADDPDRLVRFQREAQILASLNHPNIAQIHGLEESDNTRCIVMELVGGETLWERLMRGPIPVDEALAIAKQIADGLEAAHEKGIIHRDLKPANIKLTPDGQVKVLDFGLAKAFHERPESRPSDSPTLMSASVPGMILGTAAYMAPEQAKGRTADKRSDVWAFGVVLYEMLTGHRAFNGEDVSDTLAAVLKDDPDWKLLPADLPSTISTLVKRCLAKDRKQRIADITIVQFLLNEPALAAPERGLSRRGKIVALGVGISVLAMVAAVWQGMRDGPTPPHPVTRFALVPPQDVSFLTGQNVPVIALSPDGTRLVYAARVGSGNPQIYSRSLDQLDAVPIRGTDGARFAFFSPDGQWIGFNSLDGKLKKVPIGGGPVVTLSDAGFAMGATWLPDDSIIFRPFAGVSLFRVSAAGGKPEEFLKPDGKSEISLRWPEALPGGKAILFSIERRSTDFTSDAIGALRLDTRERRVLVEGGMHPHYISSGHLVFARGGAILAVPFDQRTLQVKGSPVPVIEGVLTSTAFAMAQFTASSLGGSMAYMPGDVNQDKSTLVWVDRHGATQPVAAPKRNYEFPRLSPDGQQMAVRINGGSDPGQDIWLYQFGRGTLSRFTSKANDAETPVWTSDGKRVAFAMTSSNPSRQIVWKLADGSAGQEVLVGSDRHLHLGGWTAKGDALVATATDTGSIWILEMADKRTLRPFLEAPYQIRAGTISPDGRWLAYASNDTNRFEVYVQPFPNLSGKYLISSDGGTEPIWAKNGRELFYRNGDKMMAVAIGEKGDRLEPGTPTLLFEGRFAVSTASGSDAWYDVSPDAKRFIMLKTEDLPNGGGSINMVQDWINELKRLVPNK